MADKIFTDHRLGIFFGVLVLFFSVTGLLGYIPKELIVNTTFLVIFILGTILGALLIEVGIAPYFSDTRQALKKASRRRR